MKRILDRIGTCAVLTILMSIGLTGIVAAQDEYDCPASISSADGTTSYAYAYGVYDSGTHKTTYTIDTVNKPGGEVIELCIYPDPDIDVSDSDLDPDYDNWQIDNPGSKPGFGFIARGTGAIRMPLDGSVNTIGSVRYASGPSPSETLLLHMADPDQCGGSSTCWLFPSMESPQSPPIADPNGPYTGIEGTAINFDGSGSSDSDGYITSYSWDFGDSIIGTGVSPSHTYTQNGVYIVTLTVTDNSGASNSSTSIATITDSDPVSIFSGTPISGVAPLTVTFTDSSTSYDGITLWRWDFENDSIIDSIEQNPVHEYISAGTYTVSLTVCEADGDCASSTGTITVIAPTPTPTPTPTDTTTPTPTPTPTSTPPPGDTIGPSQPLCPVAIAINPTTINISWQASVDNVGVVGYKVYRSTDGENYYYLTTTTNLYYVDPGLATGTTYYYVIRAVDAAGNPSIPSDEAYATPRDVSPPVVTVPSSMIAEATSPSGAIVTFSASAIDDIDGSIISVCNPASGSIFHLGITTITCTATDNAGNIGSAIFTIWVRDTTPPTPPSGLTATAISESRIDLSWIASSDAVGTIRYIVYRSLDGANFAAIGTTTSAAFQNTGLMADTTYYYKIGARDTANNPSANSSIASAKTFVPPTPTPTVTSTPGTPGPTPTSTPTPVPDYPPILTLPPNMILEATSPNGAVAIFSVSAYDNEDGEYKTVTCDYASGSTFPIGTTYVTCTAADSVGNIGSGVFEVTVQDTTPPTAPSSLTATAISTTGIDLNWITSTDNIGVRNYRVYRSLNNINWRSIGTTSGISFADRGLISNTTYYYYIVAYDTSDNPSVPSNIVSAKTFVLPPNPPPTPGPTGTATPTGTSTPAPTSTETPNPCLPTTGNTPIGENIEVGLTGSIINIQFSAVSQCGDTTSISYYSNQWGPLPTGYQAMKFYDMSTTASYTNGITISITYSPPSDIDEETLRMFHYENGNWVDITTALDTLSHTIVGRVTSLSPFVLAGSGSESGSGSGTVRAASIDNIGFIILSISLITISVLNLRKKR